MYVRFTTVAQTENQRDLFIDSLKITSEAEFHISSGTFSHFPFSRSYVHNK